MKKTLQTLWHGMTSGGVILVFLLCTTATTYGQVMPAKRPDLVIVSCEKRMQNPGEIDGPEDAPQVRMRFKILIKNQGEAKSSTTQARIHFHLHNADDVISQTIPSLPGSQQLHIQGTSPYLYKWERTFRPQEIIPGVDLNNGLAATVTVDPTNKVAESEEGNNVVRYDLSPGLNWPTSDGAWKVCPILP